MCARFGGVKGIACPSLCVDDACSGQPAAATDAAAIGKCPHTRHTRRTKLDREHALFVQVQGKNLVPFTFDKQVLFMETVYSIFGADTIPAGLMNFSDWRAAEAATSTSSKCVSPRLKGVIVHRCPDGLDQSLL